MSAPVSLPVPLSAVTLEAWFIACRSDELGTTPIARTLQRVPLVLFRRGDGSPAALLDRCPHRNAPLSLGRRESDGTLRCGYHGWRFEGDGTCREIPGSCEPGDVQLKVRHATSFAVRELDGYVWVFTAGGATAPKGEPFRFPLMNAKGYTTVRRDYRVRSTMHAAIENALDVPHTAFLHGGLFRTARKKSEIEVVVRRSPGRVEAEYVGEPRPPGIAGRILSPAGGVVVHFDRFLMPCIAQVEYRLGESSHLMTTSAMTPVSELETHVWAMVTFKLPVPAFLVRPLLTPIGERIFRQDAVMLAAQTDTIAAFGGEKFVHTEIDVLGQQIWRLLKQGERKSGEPGDDEAGAEKEIRLRMLV